MDVMPKCLFYFLAQLCILHLNVAFEQFGQTIGCLKFMNESSYNYYVKVNSSASIYKVETCLNSCLELDSYRYAGLQIAKGCLCISYIGSHDPGICESTCPGNSTQVCGGVDSLSIYATGHFVPGPPSSLDIIDVSDSSVEVKWTKPQAMNGLISQYTVSAIYLETHAAMSVKPRLLLSYPNTTFKADLLNLHPGTRYNISVVAESDLGVGTPNFTTVWTHIGDPTEPEQPEIISRGKNSMTISLKPYQNENGPVTGFRVIVITEENVFFEPHNLQTWSEAQDNDIPYYIAAEIDPENSTNHFVIGDGRTYGTFFNPPLISKNYRVALGVRSTFQGITKFAYSRGTDRNVGVVFTNTNDNNQLDLVSGLIAAIVFSTIVLCGLFIAYFEIRRRLSYRRRRAPYRQELTLQGPIIEVVNDGYIPEEVEERVNYYEKLQQQVWNIPRSVLEIRSEVICQGQFGAVFKGVVQQRGIPITSTIYVIEDGKLSSADKKIMLQDLGVLINCGIHTNVLRLVGTCEIPDTLFVVLEYCPIVLKNMLLESRCQDNANVYSKFSSLSESSLLRTAAGIARGMDYLSSLKVVHKQLAARNIAMGEGDVPKITGFGLTSFYKRYERPDYTRWTSLETFKRNLLNSRSDVWSFGILLWEMFALGGTPYSDIQSTDVCTRVIHGLRLPQMRYIGDGLYHLMLQCWQIDLDERPSFLQIADVLDDIEKYEVHSELNFTVYPGFQYPPHVASLEYQQ